MRQAQKAGRNRKKPITTALTSQGSDMTLPPPLAKLATFLQKDAEFRDRVQRDKAVPPFHQGGHQNLSQFEGPVLEPELFLLGAVVHEDDAPAGAFGRFQVFVGACAGGKTLPPAFPVFADDVP